VQVGVNLGLVVGRESAWQGGRRHRELVVIVGEPGQRGVEQVLAGAPQTRIAVESGIPRSTLGRLVRRTREMG